MNTCGTITNLLTKEVHEIVAYEQLQYGNRFKHLVSPHDIYWFQGVMFRNSKPDIKVQGPYLLNIYDGNEDGYFEYILKFIQEEYQTDLKHGINYQFEAIDNFEAMRLAKEMRR